MSRCQLCPFARSPGGPLLHHGGRIHVRHGVLFQLFSRPAATDFAINLLGVHTRTDGACGAHSYFPRMREARHLVPAAHDDNISC